MSTDSIIEQLRQEIAELRHEVERLRADRTVHHYHHQAAPAPLMQPPLSPTVVPRPIYPGGPYPATCGGTALGVVGLASECRNESAWGAGLVAMVIEGGTDFAKTSGPNAP